MPDEGSYTLVPFPADGFFWAVFRGEVSLGCLARAHAEFTNHPAYSPGIDELVDLADASILSLARPEIDVIRGYMTRRADRHHCKSALVVGSTTEYGLGRMLGSSMEFDVPADRWIGRSRREALEWLRPGRADELLASFEQQQAGLRAS